METYGLEKLGIVNPRAVYRNLSPAVLTEMALARGDGELMDNGALLVKTGKYTGRSAKDKFIVDTPAVHGKIAWGKVNVPVEKAKFDAAVEVLTHLIENGTENDEFYCEDPNGAARNIMYVIEGL